MSCSTEQHQQQSNHRHQGGPPPTKHVITIKEMQFTPATITVNTGDTVVFVNQDMLVHDVTEASGKAWTSGPIPVGKSFQFIVKRPVAYFCSIHPSMRGEIVVK
jgi:plastocyanin